VMSEDWKELIEAHFTIFCALALDFDCCGEYASLTESCELLTLCVLYACGTHVGRSPYRAVCKSIRWEAGIARGERGHELASQRQDMIR